MSKDETLKRVVVATGNRGKLAEIMQVMHDAQVELIAQSDLGIVDAEETGTTFIENAIIKARHAARLSGLPALADDSGLLIDALYGAPGLISAHYGGVHGDSARNIARVLAELKDVPNGKRQARFVSVMVLMRHADDPAPIIAEGWWSGEILTAPRGNHGFGYDPIFFDPEHQLSAAEMQDDLKNRISHRGQALARLCSLMRLGARADACEGARMSVANARFVCSR